MTPTPSRRAAATTETATASAPTMEPIAPDYRNVRGVDFIPSYRDVTSLLAISTSHPAFHDVASGAAGWAGYDTAPRSRERLDIDAQLARIHDVGFNTVRVWLSFHYYSFAPEKMVAKFQDFLRLCQTRGLHVIPVVWDADFHEPDASSLPGPGYENYQKWIMSPGNTEIARRNGHLGAIHERFVTDMLTAAAPFMPPKASPRFATRTLLIWDVMNEPVFDPSQPDQHTWIAETLTLIKDTAIDAVTAVTPPVWAHDNPLHSALAADDNLDVLGFNFYGFGPRDIEGKCDNASSLLEDSEPFKPILVMEAGLLGSGQHYPEAIDLLSRVPSSATGNPNGPGVGFCLFSANVGQQAHPIRNPRTGEVQNINFVVSELGDGLFYGPRFDTADPVTGARTIYLRDYGPRGSTTSQPTLAAIAALASSQTGATWTPIHSYASMPIHSPLFPGYEEPVYLPDGTNRAVCTEMIAQAAAVAPGCSVSEQNRLLLSHELRVAKQMAVWSFFADLSYRLSASDHLLATSPAGAPQDPYAMLASMTKRAEIIETIADGNPTWWTDSQLLGAYSSLFGDVHHYWTAGGYDTWYAGP